MVILTNASQFNVSRVFFNQTGQLLAASSTVEPLNLLEITAPGSRSIRDLVAAVTAQFFQSTERDGTTLRSPELQREGLSIWLTGFEQSILADDSLPQKSACISTFQALIYRSTSIFSDRQKLKDLIESDRYKHSSALSPVIKKIRYLMKNRLFSSWAEGLLINTRFSHHLSGVLGNLKQSGKGQNYFLAGVASVATGFFSMEPRLQDDHVSEQTKKVGIVLITGGFSLMFSPFVSAYLYAKTDDPN